MEKLLYENYHKILIKYNSWDNIIPKRESRMKESVKKEIMI